MECLSYSDAGKSWIEPVRMDQCGVWPNTGEEIPPATLNFNRYLDFGVFGSRAGSFLWTFGIGG